MYHRVDLGDYSPKPTRSFGTARMRERAERVCLIDIRKNTADSTPDVHTANVGKYDAAVPQNDKAHNTGGMPYKPGYRPAHRLAHTSDTASALHAERADSGN